MRVLFTGHPGLNKRAVLERLKEYILCQNPDWHRASAKERRALAGTVFCCHLEDRLYSPDISDYLDIDYWEEQQDRWIRAVDDVAIAVNRAQPAVVLLSVHLTYNWMGQIISPHAWRHRLAGGDGAVEPATRFLVKQLRLDRVVNLIDDVGAVQARIHAKSEQIRLKNLHFRLRELLLWRNIETMLTDLVGADIADELDNKVNRAAFPFEHSPVVAVRHDVPMLYRLLFEPTTVLRCYASFPITRTRAVHFGEIDCFRELLSQEFAVFDPLTIDERPLLSALFEHLGVTDNPSVEQVDAALDSADLEGVRLQIPQQHFWQIEPGKTLCGEARKGAAVGASEVREVAARAGEGKMSLSRAIELRDFRLIDQADVVVMYRPKFAKGTWSGGTLAERHHANRSLGGRPVYVIHDPADGGEYVYDEFDAIFRSKRRLFQFQNLSDPSVQKDAIADVVRALKEDAPGLIARRHPS